MYIGVEVRTTAKPQRILRNEPADGGIIVSGPVVIQPIAGAPGLFHMLHHLNASRVLVNPHGETSSFLRYPTLMHIPLDNPVVLIGGGWPRR